MLTITLTRQIPQAKAVPGSIVLPFSQRLIDPELPEQDITVATLENADYLIPAGTYPFKRTYSYKFKKILPLVDEVPDRIGIRIHLGSKPEHSTGCILVDFAGLSYINTMFNRLITHYNNEELQLTIRDA